MNDPLPRLERRLDYRFRDPALLVRALTHRSHGAGNNERLEFLGDALINFVVGDALYRQCPKAEEGALSRLRASLVREESLAELARGLQLGDVLNLGESELKSGGFRRDSIIADALEAVIGAIHLDGGFEAAQKAALQLYAPLLANLPDPDSLKDAKTRLQEWLQAQARPLPRYDVLSESGPPHRREFLVRCSLLDADQTTEAAGSSRRIAQQRAAEAMLKKLSGGAHA
ncbi:MAG: ribonuclease III [Nevskiaceae bacterium]|nr:MAG: ribonuclease III [Nevskiaceae bacterium]